MSGDICPDYLSRNDICVASDDSRAGMVASMTQLDWSVRLVSGQSQSSPEPTQHSCRIEHGWQSGRYWSHLSGWSNI